MDTVEEKIKSLDYRIGNVTKQMDDLLQTKINLMMIKREVHMNNCKITLEDSLTDELKELLTGKFKTELDLDKVVRSHKE